LGQGQGQGQGKGQGSGSGVAHLGVVRGQQQSPGRGLLPTYEQRTVLGRHCGEAAVLVRGRARGRARVGARARVRVGVRARVRVRAAS
jgi:hypothetical protein